MKVEKVTFPAFLASALINGDTSGLSDDDNKWLDKALKFLGDGSVVSCEDETHFSRWCDLPGWRLGADMLVYSVLYPEETRYVEGA